MLFIDSTVEATETAASSVRDHNLTTPNARSESSVNKGVLNAKFVYNINFIGALCPVMHLVYLPA